MKLPDELFYDDNVMYSRRAIENKVTHLGRVISEEYYGKQLVIIEVLNGASTFVSDLIRCIDLPLELDTISVSSYKGTESTGTITLLKDIRCSIEGKEVLIVDDILDTGLTLEWISNYLENYNPKSIQVAACLKKKKDNQKKVDCKYFCFECEDEFVVGYGLDYNGLYRNLPHIAILPNHLRSIDDFDSLYEYFVRTSKHANEDEQELYSNMLERLSNPLTPDTNIFAL